MVFLEGNAILEAELSDVMSFVSDAAEPIVWAGWKKRGAWGSVLGSKCIAFASNGLALIHQALSARDNRLVFADMWISRALGQHVARPSISYFGGRRHWSVSEGKRKTRPAFRTLRVKRSRK